MLIDKYLSAYDFNDRHSIKVNVVANDIYGKTLSCDFSRSFLIRLLFRLRGMPKQLYRIEDLTAMGFTKLDEHVGKEVVYGIITSSPTFSCCESDLSPTSFIIKTSDSIIKAVINFQVMELNNSNHIISTETRVWCSNNRIRDRFRLYWLFVKPFSQLIRKAMLKEIKNQLLNRQM